MTGSSAITKSLIVKKSAVYQAFDSRSRKFSLSALARYSWISSVSPRLRRFSMITSAPSMRSVLFCAMLRIAVKTFPPLACTSSSFVMSFLMLSRMLSCFGSVARFDGLRKAASSAPIGFVTFLRRLLSISSFFCSRYESRILLIFSKLRILSRMQSWIRLLSRGYILYSCFSLMSLSTFSE